ncbi:MAG: zinc-ribbon and DUF3426 domain-containing protein [Xanthomonadales bacterium]|nr:zinc-ribbon and DUF3426 domain-containing protein [Xanthomonadales bacterium]
MYTQCPECSTVFKLDGASLAAAHGSVRCGHCAAVFDGLRSLATELPPEPFDRLPAWPLAAGPPQLGLPVYRPNPAQGALFAAPEREARPRPPAFATRRARRPRRNGPWLAACALLLVALAAQAAWSERDRWLDAPRVRAWLDPACARLGCTLPLRRDAARLVLSSRDIRPHPSAPGALIISATLRNDAPFAQAYPTLKITLSNLDERRVAMRRFRPDEYIGDRRELAAGLGPGASSALAFEVVDPGQDAVAFEFDFE